MMPCAIGYVTPVLLANTGVCFLIRIPACFAAGMTTKNQAKKSTDTRERAGGEKS
jgi:hypothetical protein